MTLDDETYLARFHARTLGPEFFDHRGHLRMAWLHLRHFHVEEATARVCEGVRDLATKFGAPEKFNYTLTEAFMRIVARRMREHEDDGFEAFLQRNADLLTDAKGVVARHYSDERLHSAPARATWIGPDRAPFD
jgi:hypothetical protein